MIVAVNHAQYVDLTFQDFRALFKHKDNGLLVDIKGMYRHLSDQLNYWSF